MAVKIIYSEVYIQKVLALWRTNFLKSAILIVDDTGIQRLDIKTAEKHYKFVSLCDTIYSGLSHYDPKAKYISNHTRAILKSQRSKENMAYAQDVIDQLEITLSLEEIINDYNSDRAFLKQTFKDIFRLYGIPLNQKMLDQIFGKKQLDGSKIRVDSISEFTIGTSLPRNLCNQFGTTVSLQGTGIFSIFFMRASGLLGINGCSYNPISEDETKYIKDLCPLWSESKVTRILISAALSTQVINS